MSCECTPTVFIRIGLFLVTTLHLEQLGILMIRQCTIRLVPRRYNPDLILSRKYSGVTHFMAGETRISPRWVLVMKNISFYYTPTRGNDAQTPKSLYFSILRTGTSRVVHCRIIKTPNCSRCNVVTKKSPIRIKTVGVHSQCIRVKVVVVCLFQTELMTPFWASRKTVIFWTKCDSALQRRLCTRASVGKKVQFEIIKTIIIIYQFGTLLRLRRRSSSVTNSSMLLGNSATSSSSPSTFSSSNRTR